MFASDAGKETTDRLTILAKGLTVTGDIEADGVIKIEGTVEGSIRSKGQVLVAQGGLVEGDIHTDRAVVGGEVRGSLEATGKVELEASSLIQGNLVAPVLVMAEGGKINGQVSMQKTEPVRVIEPPVREPALAVS